MIATARAIYFDYGVAAGDDPLVTELQWPHDQPAALSLSAATSR